MADESLLGMASARELIDKNACNHFNLKISKLGGLLTALDVYQLAHANGIPCQLGAHFGETSLLGTAGIILANKAPQLTNLEGAMSGLLLENDIFAPAVQHDLKGQLNSEEYLKLHGWSSCLEAGAFDQYAHLLL
jgi:L-alanine-DL-glutamate epimerase-like enolase superfamily enzyme